MAPRHTNGPELVASWRYKRSPPVRPPEEARVLTTTTWTKRAAFLSVALGVAALVCVVPALGSAAPVVQSVSGSGSGTYTCGTTTHTGAAIAFSAQMSGGTWSGRWTIKSGTTTLAAGSVVFGVLHDTTSYALRGHESSGCGSPHTVAIYGYCGTEKTIHFASAVSSESGKFSDNVDCDLA
jgi:hypothetical protein